MLGGDLLNYILDKEPSRLTERDSKFIIFQVKIDKRFSVESPF